MRWNCAKVARPIWAALLIVSIAGCQNNGERDLMARDRRMQEDQMWAMQDYIQQYQALVCRFRSENAALRRQLNDEHGGTVVDRQPQPIQPTPMNSPSNPPYRNNTPRPGVNNNAPPTPKADMPDVPPLGTGASNSIGDRYQTIANAGATEPRQSNQFVQQASYDAPIERRAGNVDASAQVDADPVASTDVLLSGEVVANENGGGPRLVIDVESFDQSGRSTPFDGNVSLALVASFGGTQQRLARWDFGPDDVRSAVGASASESTMRFMVELPSDTKVDGATQLLARLRPTNGGSILSHAKLDLSKPGLFSSRTDKIWASEESIVAASYDEPASEQPEPAPAMNEGTWATAVPGKPAILPAETEQAMGGWKAASGPLPVVVANAVPTTATSTPSPAVAIERPKRLEPAPVKTQPVEVAQKPGWAPERTGTKPRATRPAWSATR
jgi:hypothetical protein